MIKKLFASLLVMGFIGLCQVNSAFAETVTYNHQSGIYHKHSCASAVRCTKNCTKIEKKEAVKKGGRPCKKCGG